MVNSDIENCKNLNDELDFFQNLTCDILVRQVVFKKFESELKKTTLTQENDFMALSWYGYIISQLSDCRKFFDPDSRAHSFQFVVRHIKDPVLKNKHHALFKSWKCKELETVINKYVLHADMRVGKINTEISMKTLDEFIDNLKKYLKDIVDDVAINYSGVSSLNYDAFLNERENDVAIFFSEVRK